jgi:hypothetical protein
MQVTGDSHDFYRNREDCSIVTAGLGNVSYSTVRLQDIGAAVPSCG